MLTNHQIALVKATVPLLEHGGEALITHFYQNLLTQHPQVRPLFNTVHQSTGAQPRALAQAVLRYARFIDQLEQLGDLPARIINKHVSLQVQPEHYGPVGACLLAAMGEVLGKEVATDEVLDAWSAAYLQLADILIGAEQQQYAAKAAAPGGWRGARRFTVVRRVAESAEITSFYLASEDGLPVLQAEPGQYLTLCLTIDGAQHRRNYSLSQLSQPRQYRISVKRQPGGVVSGWLHDHAAEGQVLDVFTPAGNFVLAASTKPLLLLSAGVGITPTLAMLEAALASARPVHFIHCARNPQVQGFDAWLQAQAQQHPQLQVSRYLSSRGERLDQSLLAQRLPVDRDIDAYLLGPQGFMDDMHQALIALGVPAAQCWQESFGPSQTVA